MYRYDRMDFYATSNILEYHENKQTPSDENRQPSVNSFTHNGLYDRTIRGERRVFSSKLNQEIAGSAYAIEEAIHNGNRPTSRSTARRMNTGIRNSTHPSASSSSRPTMRISEADSLMVAREHGLVPRSGWGMSEENLLRARCRIPPPGWGSRY